MVSRFSKIMVLSLLASAPLSAQPIGFCSELVRPAARVEGEAVERVIVFNLTKDTFALANVAPVSVAPGTAVQVHYKLGVEGGEQAALRYTGSSLARDADSPAKPPLCPTPVEEAPDCDGAATPFYDVGIINRDQLPASCLASIDLAKMLCILELEADDVVLQVDNQQSCTQDVRVGLLMTVKSTRSVEVNGQRYRRQFQTPDPTLILEPVESKPPAAEGP